jgi:hypothetical protein
MGGNIFKDYASPIAKDRIRPTYVEYVRHLGVIFPLKADVFKNFVFVGSSGKKDVSGDLDLAIDMSHFFIGEPFNKAEMSDWRINYDFWEQEYLGFKKRARTATDTMLRWKAFLKCIGNVISKDCLVNVSSKVTNGNLFTMFPQFDRYGQTNDFVQIDWMVGNVDWLSFAYHSAENAPLKGLHRTQFMVAMASAKGYTFLHTKGIKNKLNNDFVAKTPEQALSLFSSLYGDITMRDTVTFRGLHSYFKANSTEEDYKAVIESYLRILRISRATIPKDLEDENSRFTWS